MLISADSCSRNYNIITNLTININKLERYELRTRINDIEGAKQSTIKLSISMRVKTNERWTEKFLVHLALTSIHNH